MTGKTVWSRSYIDNYFSDEILGEMAKKKLDEVTESEKDDGIL